MVTQVRLKKLINYNSETGNFTWKTRGIEEFSGCKSPLQVMNAYNTRFAGTVAGSVSKSLGYILICIERKSYLSHRLVWMYVYGYFPESEIDHINRIREDNRFENLREVSHSCNMRNQSKFSTNKSGVTGVCWYKKTEKWRSTIKIPDKVIHLGYYSDFNEAVKARWEVEVKYNFPNCNTTSSAYEYLKENNSF